LRHPRSARASPRRSERGWFARFAEAAGAMAGEITQVFEPDPRRAARYGDLLAIHRDLWPTLASWNAARRFRRGGA
jgi:hypothetical protein